MLSATLLAHVVAAMTATSDVRAIAEYDGAQWRGTTGGLVRSDAESEQTFTPLNGLPDGTIRSLAPIGEALWVGTDRGAASVRFEDGELVVGRVVGQGLRVQAIAGHGDALFLGTTTGLFRTALCAGTGDAIERVGDYGHVTALLEAHGDLYVATAGQGAFRLRGAERLRLRGDRLTWALMADGDAVLVATSRGVRRYVDGRWRRSRMSQASRSLPVSDIRALHKADGVLAIGTFGGGAYVWTGSEFEVAGAPSDSEVQAIGFSDHSEHWLIGTSAGLYEEGRSGAEMQLPDNDISALARTAEGVWVGTFDRGLALIDHHGSIQHFGERDGLVDERINRLTVDGEGHLWIATDRGVVERDAYGFHLRGLAGRHVFAIRYSAGAVYAGAGADVYRYSGAEFLHVSQPGRRPQDFATAAGGLVVASAEGLVQGTSDAWSLATSAGAHGIPDDWVTGVSTRRGEVFFGMYNAGVARVRDGIVESLRDDLWVNAGALVALRHGLAVGTLDDGLWLELDGGWQQLTTRDGLPDNDVTAILPMGDGTLWVATRGGLSRVVLAL